MCLSKCLFLENLFELLYVSDRITVPICCQHQPNKAEALRKT